MRLSSVYGWREGVGLRGDVHAAVEAARHADRLSERDRALLRVYVLFAQGDPAAADTVGTFLRRYPDDLEARYLLGEILYHDGPLRPVPPESVTAAFDAVVRLDSSLTPALIHPAELSLAYRDSAAYARYLAALERSTGRPDSAGRAALDIVWGSHGAAHDGLRRTLFAETKRTSLIKPGIVWDGVWRDPGAGSDRILASLIAREAMGRADDPVRVSAMVTHSIAASGLGRLAEGRRMAYSLFPHDLRRAMIATSFPVLIGLDPRLPQEVADRLARRATPVASMVRAQFALVRGDAAAARAVLARALRDTSAAAPVPRALLEATEGWADLIEGDTTAGLARLAEGALRPARGHVGGRADAAPSGCSGPWRRRPGRRPGRKGSGVSATGSPSTRRSCHSRSTRWARPTRPTATAPGPPSHSAVSPPVGPGRPPASAAGAAGQSGADRRDQPGRLTWKRCRMRRFGAEPRADAVWPASAAGCVLSGTGSTSSAKRAGHHETPLRSIRHARRHRLY